MDFLKNEGYNTFGFWECLFQNPLRFRLSGFYVLIKENDLYENK